ncbi:MAG TPA: GTP cyclohydrolase, partial [Microvirga sp.]|nr:GTP cyclohydrolase [Microvirga sp.]
MMRLVLSLSDNPATTSVERAIMEFRSARPVVIDGIEGSALVVGVEDLDEERSAEIEGVAGGQAHLVLPAARLRRLGLEKDRPGRLALPVVERERIEALALKIDGRIDAPVCGPGPLDEDALELSRLALILPAMLVVPVVDPAEVD